MKKILVTGGGGMIGLEVSKQLANLKYQVNLLDLGEQIKRIQPY
jgi:Nucleoside-diphosphate-sugar epimerases